MKKTVVLTSSSSSSSIENTDSCYFPGCRKDANCKCDICLDSINATLDLSFSRSNITRNENSNQSGKNVKSPVMFDAKILSTPDIKSTARARFCNKVEEEKKDGNFEKNEKKGSNFGFLMKNIFVFLVLLLTLVLGMEMEIGWFLFVSLILLICFKISKKSNSNQISKTSIPFDQKILSTPDIKSTVRVRFRKNMEEEEKGGKFEKNEKKRSLIRNIFMRFRNNVEEEKIGDNFEKNKKKGSGFCFLIRKFLIFLVLLVLGFGLDIAFCLVVLLILLICSKVANFRKKSSQTQDFVNPEILSSAPTWEKKNAEKQKKSFMIRNFWKKNFLILMVLGMGMEYGFDYGVSRVMRPELSAEKVIEVAEKTRVMNDLNAKLGVFRKELQGLVNGKVADCESFGCLWKIKQGDLLLNSQCILYKSAKEEVSIWGWPLQTAGLLTAEFSPRLFTILSGSVTEWSNGKVSNLTLKTHQSWIQRKWSASVVQLEPRTWIIEYKQARMTENSSLVSLALEFLSFWFSRQISRIKQEFWLMPDLGSWYNDLNGESAKVPT